MNPSILTNFFFYTLGIFIFMALVVLAWLWNKLSNATGKLDDEIETLRRWQHDHMPMEKRLSELEMVLEALPHAVVLIDPQLAISYVNQAALQALGVAKHSLVGKQYQAGLPFQTTDGNSVYVDKKNIVLECFESRQGLEHQHYQLPISTQHHPLDVSWIPLLNEHQQALGAMVLFDDVFKQTQLEEMKADFVSIVSHELRTPITAIKGYIDILLHETQLDPEHAEMLRRVYLSNERQLETVESMLNLSRLERGTIAVHPEAFHIEELVGQVVGEVEPLAKQKGLTIKFDYPRFALPAVWADPARTREVIINLCTNGIKYTDTGSVKVAIQQQAKLVQVSVTDTGPGISPDVQAKLFAKFQRGEGALTEQKQGMGLGLYITKQFVELMGGTITCQSEVGKGATFSFTLPLK